MTGEQIRAVVVYYWRDYWSLFLFLVFALGMFVVALLLARAGLEL